MGGKRKKGKRRDNQTQEECKEMRTFSPTSQNSKKTMKYEAVKNLDIEYQPCYPSILNGTRKKSVRRTLESQTVYKEQIFCVPSFFTELECDSWIQHAESIGFERSYHPASREYAHRDNGRISIHSPEVATTIWQRIQPFIPVDEEIGLPVGCNPNIRLYKYEAGQRFGRHVDESVLSEDGSEVSEYTVLIYLSGEGPGGGTPEGGGAAGGGRGGGATAGGGEGEAAAAAAGGGPLEGGETVFYRGNFGDKVAAAFVPRAGWALLHGHGRRCLLHEGARVRRGTKYVLRTDVMVAAVP